MGQRFGKIWFFCTTVQPTTTDSGITVPAIVAYLNGLASDHRIFEHQWAEADAKGPVHGWFQPNDHEIVDEIGRYPGMTLLPSLYDPTPLGADLAKLLAHASVAVTDTAYVAVKKLHDYHVTQGHGVNRSLRPLLY